MRHIGFSALSAFLIMGVGCKSNDKSAATEPTPSASATTTQQALTVKWVGKRFSVEGERARGNFVVPSRPEDSQGLSVRSYLYDFPAGSKATFGGKTATVQEGKPLVQNANFADKVATLDLTDVQRKRVDLDIPLVIDVPGRGELKLETPPLRIAHAVAHELSTIEKEPVKFEGEKADSGEPDTVAIIRVRSRSRRMRVLGDGKTVADIDWIAIERTHGEPRKHECPRPGKKPRILKLTDLELAVFERLTGKAIEKQVFPAKPRCQPVPRGEQGPKTQRDEMDEWLIAKLGLPPEAANPAPSRKRRPSGMIPGVTRPGQRPGPAGVAEPPAKPAAPAPKPATPARPAPKPAQPAPTPAAPAQ